MFDGRHAVGVGAAIVFLGAPAADRLSIAAAVASTISLAWGQHGTGISASPPGGYTSNAG